MDSNLEKQIKGLIQSNAINNNEISDLNKLKDEGSLFNTGIIRPVYNLIGNVGNVVSVVNVANFANGVTTLPEYLEHTTTDYKKIVGDIPDHEGGKLTVEEAKLFKIKIKTNSFTFGLSYYTLLDELRPGLKLKDTINTQFREMYMSYLSEYIAATLTSLSKDTSIKTGTSTTDYKSTDIKKLLSKVKNNGNNRRDSKGFLMLMSSATVDKILEKEDDYVRAAQTKKEHYTPLITYSLTNLYVKKTNTPDFMIQPSYILNKTVPIYISDDLDDGLIFLIKKGSFLFKPIPIKNPFSMQEDILENKEGRASFLTYETVFILHPDKFSFIGQHKVDYENTLGIRLTELKAKKLFSLACDVKDTPILIHQIKMS